ncbi:MAG: helix-turn-helix domain-containing protein [Deltaproteobacteria bacterium]|nr:helix-turn-helix domain-containing protein [Deltaproteobacteria bacterium]MBW2069953.1 helix-turn-helix domain-containing protein [Deltaproteobacteria bacterium]
MKSLGEYLRSEREARGISLEEIVADTKISLLMLNALEAGNTTQLPAPVLVKGFLRAYAERVGLDPEAVVLRYQDLIEEESTGDEALVKFHERQIRSSRTRKGLLLGAGAAAILGVAGVILWLILHFQPQLPSGGLPQVGPQETAAPSAAVEKQPSSKSSPGAEAAAGSTVSAVKAPGSEPSPAAAEEEVAAPAPEEQPSSTTAKVVAQPQSAAEKPAAPKEEPAVKLQLAAGSRTPPEPTLTAPYELRAEAVEPTWLKIIIDDRKPSEYILKSGEVMKWQAKSKFKLRIGNAAGVKLFLNSKPLKPLGASGQVVQLLLPDPALMQESYSETPSP